MSELAGRAGSSRLAAFGSKLVCPVNSRGAGRESAICAAVVDLLNETTYESLTMDAVAARAKASKATIYRRWSNKNDLVVDAVQRVLLDHAQGPIDTGSLRGDIMARIQSQAADHQLVSANTAALKTLIFAASSDAGLAHQIQDVMRSVQLPAWQIVLDRAQQRGETTRRVDASVIYDVMVAQFCSRISVQAKPIDLSFIEHVIDDVFIPVISHAGSKVPV